MEGVKSVILSLALVLVVVSANEVEIEYQDGRVKGVKMQSPGGKEYLAFRGIPYAESPGGELRFKPPIAKKPLTKDEELDATKDGPVCPQIDILTKKLIGQEDCLILNVYSPEDTITNPHKKYPVMMWIHGGGWQFGFSSSWMYGPGIFMDKEIVFVSINYRLGPLGFLTTNDKSSPGNYGMLDQVEALKWIKENIEDFGGDAEQVTIIGQSAGSTSTFYHMLSPLSRGLFHGVIALSGNPLCFWAVNSDPVHWTNELARNVDCPIDDNEVLVECLRKVDANELITKAAPLSMVTGLPFTPKVDGYFLESDPRQMLMDGKIYTKVPVITGMTKEEGAGFYALMYRKLVEYSDEFLEKAVQKTFNSAPNHAKLTEAIKEKYFNNIDLKNKLEVAKQFSKFITDALDVANYATIEYLNQNGIKSYAYSFDFHGKASIVSVFGIKHRLGVAHGDDLIYMFENQILGKFGSDDDISNKFITFLTNFAISGDPKGDFGVEWSPVTQEDFPICHIDKSMKIESIIPQDDPKYNFWFKTVPEILSQPLSPKDEL